MKNTRQHFWNYILRKGGNLMAQELHLNHPDIRKKARYKPARKDQPHFWEARG